MQRIIILVSDLRHARASDAEFKHNEYLTRLDEHLQGVELEGDQCSILWIVLGKLPEAIATALMGFKAVRVVVNQECVDELHESDIRDTIGHHILCDKDIEIEACLELMSPPSLGDLPIWYYGLVEHSTSPTSGDHEVLKQALKETLPLPHQPKVGVWLEIVAGSETYKNLLWDCGTWVDLREVLSLAQLLWSFEEASGSDCNGFDVEHILESLGVADFECEESQTCGCSVVGIGAMNSGLPSAIEPGVPGKARRQFSGAEGMFFSLWYSCFRDYRYSTKEKLEMLFDLSGGSDEAERKLSSYSVIQEVF